jgi:hypothetical protein
MKLFILIVRISNFIFLIKHKMKKILIIISLVFCSNCLLGQVDYTWSVGVTYKPFFFTLLNEADDANEQFQQIENNLTGNNYFGLTVNYHFYNRMFVGSGLGYSNQTLKYKFANTGSEDIVFNGRGNSNLKYIHIPMRIGYQLSANHLDFMGIRFYSELLTSYNSSYYWEGIFYDKDFLTNEVDFTKIDVLNRSNDTYRESIIYDVDGEVQLLIENEIKYPINRWNLGIQTGADIYFIISQTVNVNIGMWYGYDFLRTEAKDMATYTSSGKRPADAYSNNQRVGLSVGLEWLIF